MPGLTGLEVAKRLQERVHLVFVTAFDQFAVDAFEREAVDYLLKPVSDERLERTVSRLRERLAQHEAPAEVREALARLALWLPGEAASGPARLEWIRAAVGNQVRLIPVDEVCYFHAEDKYTKVVTTSGEALIRKTIRELFDVLDPEVFWQVHRGTIVNLRAIARVERDYRDQPLVFLKDRPEPLTVSRTFAHLFKTM